MKTWKIATRGTGLYVVDQDDKPICDMEADQWSMKEAMADARLIAAAPDLLEALKRFMMQAVITPEPESAFMQAQSAIKKAEAN